MKAIGRHPREWVTLGGWIAALILALVLVGCGGSDTQSDSKVIVKNPQRTQQVTRFTPPPQPAVDTIAAPAKPEEQVVVGPEPQREVTFEEAEAAFHEGQYERAAELFTLYTERKNENPWGYYMLGLSARKADQHEIAKGAFERALELDPKHVKSQLNLSRVLMDMGAPEDALVHIRAALELDPESSVAYRLKGRVFDAIHQLPQAVEAYRDALRLDNDDAWSMNNLALIYIEEGLYAEALPPLARAVEIQSSNAVFLNNLGMALECNGHFRASETAYETAATVGYEKAAANLARAQDVREDTELDPVDLEMIARIFADEIAGRDSEVAVEEEQEPAEAEVAAGEQDDSVESEEDTESDGDGDSVDKEEEEK